MAGQGRRPFAKAESLLHEAVEHLRTDGGRLDGAQRRAIEAEMGALVEALQAGDPQAVESSASRLAAARARALAPARKSVVREYVEAIVIAIVVALFIRTFVIQAFKIPSGSMEPTLLVGDHILVNKFLYGTKIPLTDVKVLPLTEPRRGDVVVFVYPVDPDKDFIKRVIATAGETVEVRDKRVYVNGRPIADPFAVHREDSLLPAAVQPRDNVGPVTLPPGTVFVMGDNRDRSYDSRFWGPVRLSQIKGKAFIVYFSWQSDYFRVRWNRLGDLIH